MKNLLFLLSITFLTGCIKHEAKDSCCMKSTETNTSATNKVIPEMSLYNLSMPWKNQKGEEITLVRYSGKIQIVAMIYTECSYACPRIIADLKRIEDELKKYNSDQYSFLLVSMDSQRDTPQQLLKFAEANSLYQDKWNLITSSDNSIRELAAVLNVKYKRESNGEISHSNIITILDREGEILYQQEGLGLEPDQLVKAVVDQLKST